MVRIIPSRNFKYGTVDSIEAESIPRGAISRSLNWLTMGDHVELRRGQVFVGDEITGAGKVSGLRKVVQNSGVEYLFSTIGKKLRYLDRTTELWVENGSDALGTSVVDSAGIARERITMSEYVSPAGNQLWVNSPRITAILKVMTANPGSSVDQYDATKNFKGHIKIDTNRTLLWGRTSDKTGLYGSYIDTQTYTTVTNEALGTGDGADTTFSGTLAARTGRRTAFALVITAGAVILTDDYNGNLRDSSDVVRGTINYATGAWDVTFAVAPANLLAITGTYQWEDATVNGIGDFTKSATRLAGQGFVFRQDEGGGALVNVATLDQIYYCFHVKKTWVLTIGADDTDATNLPYRQNVGISSMRGALEAGNGIYYGDDVNGNDKRVRVLTYQVAGSTKIIPVSISNNLNLNEYSFDEAAAIEFGDLVLISCATVDSVAEIDGVNVASNNRTLAYNKIWKSWDILDYAISEFDTYDGALIGGSSSSNNVLELFSGLADPASGTEETVIPNFVEFDIDDLDHDGLDKARYIHARGTIGPDQKIKVSVSADLGAFVEVGGEDTDDGHVYAIQGDGSYVDRSDRIAIGPSTLGKNELGGGGDGVEAYNYDRLIPLGVGKAANLRVRIEAMDVGWASWSQADWYDVRSKGERIPRRHRT